VTSHQKEGKYVARLWKKEYPQTENKKVENGPFRVGCGGGKRKEGEKARKETAMGGGLSDTVVGKKG